MATKQLARAAKVTGSSKAAPVKAAKPVSKPAAKPATAFKPAPKAKATVTTGLSFLVALERLKVLSAAEKGGLLSALENAKLLSTLESSGVLSQMEKAGLLSAVADPATPGNLNIAGFLALALAAASVFAIPDEGVALFAEVALAAVLGSTGLALLSGGSLLGRLQNP